MNTTTPNIEVRRASEHGRTQIDWLDSAHSFSFGQYRDPKRMGYRSLRVINDDRITPGAGFGEHGHDNMEIISWVLDGSLRHGDSLDNTRELRPGEVQVMTAGIGIHHSEFNGSQDKPAHFLQVWIKPSKQGVSPRYDQRAIDPAKRHNAFTPIASGHDADLQADALPIHQDARVLVADIQAGGAASYMVKQARGVYIHVATGIADLSGTALEAGDAAIIESPGEFRVKGVDTAQVMLFDLA